MTDTSAPGEALIAGFAPVRLNWLCQSAQIEDTLTLLFHVNHWAKARDSLFYEDRQGLYLIKGAIIEQAFANGMLRASAYVDGTPAFELDNVDIAAELAADVLADVLAESLEMAKDHQDVTEQEPYNSLHAAAHQLFQRVTGRDVAVQADLDSLDQKAVEYYIVTRLEDLVLQARTTRQPIPPSTLSELCLSPEYLLEGVESWRWWGDLDNSDLRPLDPEHMSLIALTYQGPQAHFSFHVPFRVAEQFLPSETMHDLQQHPDRKSREVGEYIGRAITLEESLAHPIRELLRKLDVKIETVCPRKLENKNEFFAERYRIYDFNEEGELEVEEDDDDFFDYVPRRRNKTIIPSVCPVCRKNIQGAGLPRAEHWQQEHAEQDLTWQQLAWILARRKASLQSITPDYRSPNQHPMTQGQRYWKLASVFRVLHELCPICGKNIQPVGWPRAEHWQQEHAEQDLTRQHVAWILGKGKASLQNMASDYRSPDPPTQGQRYWKLASVFRILEQ